VAGHETTLSPIGNTSRLSRSKLLPSLQLGLLDEGKLARIVGGDGALAAIDNQEIARQISTTKTLKPAHTNARTQRHPSELRNHGIGHPRQRVRPDIGLIRSAAVLLESVAGHIAGRSSGHGGNGNEPMAPKTLKSGGGLLDRSGLGERMENGVGIFEAEQEQVIVRATERVAILATGEEPNARGNAERPGGVDPNALEEPGKMSRV